MTEKHDGNKVDFEMKVLISYQHNPLSRQCAEAIWIKNVDKSKIINNKYKFVSKTCVGAHLKKKKNVFCFLIL